MAFPMPLGRVWGKRYRGVGRECRGVLIDRTEDAGEGVQEGELTDVENKEKGKVVETQGEASQCGGILSYAKGV